MTSPWLVVFGRAHLLVLHLPIGLLLGTAMLEFGGALLRRPAGRGTIIALAWLSALAAGVAATSGWILAGDGDHDPDRADLQQWLGFACNTIDLHRWSGIAVAATSTLAAICSLFRARRSFRLLLTAAVLLLVPTGHFGGTLTHGDNYLFAPLRPPAEHQHGTPSTSGPATNIDGSSAAAPVAAAPTPPADAFAAVIQPILVKNCAGCHGDKKQKSRLRLNTVAGIQQGGKSGEVLVAGKPDDSEMLRRCLLPLDDEDHMPPKSKPQPTAADVELLRRWIAAGAPFTGPVAGLEPAGIAPGAAKAPPGDTPANTTPGDGKEQADDDDPPAGAEPPAAAPEALAALRAELVHTAQVAQGSTRLWIDFAATAPQIDDAAVQRLLAPVRAQVVELGLARTAITDATLQFLARAPGLLRLDLRGTGVTDAGVARLRRLDHLELLVLAQTRLSDAVVEPLAAMPALTTVYLWHAGVGPEALARLRSARPGLRVDAGDREPAAPLATETQVQLTKGEAPVAAAQAAVPADKPVNAVCPVSGKPVDPRYVLLHDGKVIGFCCPNCPAEFKANPAKFPLK